VTVSDPRLLHKVMEDARDALHDLCDPPKRSVWREDGTLTRHTADSLLAQLRDEVANSSNRGGRRRSSNSSPVGVDALDLWNTIATGALFLAAQTGAHLDGVEVEHVLRASVAAAGVLTDVEAVLGVRNALEGWLKAIRTLLDPPKRVSLWGQACPMETCGNTTVWRQDESDGEVKRTAALEIVLEEDQLGARVAKECRCLACNEVWPRNRLLFLARLLGSDVSGLGGVEEGEPAA
jgi:hypothetical protein